jgi:hypothetical protein
MNDMVSIRLECMRIALSAKESTGITQLINDTDRVVRYVTTGES